MIVPWKVDHSLGMGYKTDSNRITCLAVDFERVAADICDDPVASVDVTKILIDSSKKYARVLDASSNAGLLIGIDSLGVSAELSDNLHISKNTLHAAVIAKHQSPLRRLPGAKLSQYAIKKLTEEGPEEFYKLFGDRYIAGKSLGGRFVGVYSMSFTSAERCAAAKVSLNAPLVGTCGSDSTFSKAAAQYAGQYTSSSWVAAFGWPRPELPANSTPEDMWKAAQGMDTSVGAHLRALLCRFTELPDYQDALDRYFQSRQPIWPLLRAAQPSRHQAPTWEETDSILEARQRLGMEAAKLQYLEKMLNTEHTQSATQEIEYMLRCVTSRRLQLVDEFQNKDNLAALALYIKYQDPASASRTGDDEKQWDHGKQLADKFLQADSLEESINMLLQPSAKGMEQESEWLGSLSNGTLTRVDLDKGGELAFHCLVPSNNFNKKRPIGRYGIVHMDRAADTTLLQPWSRAATPVLRGSQVIALINPVKWLWLASSSYRERTRVLWSDPQLETLGNLSDVTRVEVLHGCVADYINTAVNKLVLQITFHKRDGTSLKVPDCSEDVLLLTSRTCKCTFPPDGLAGRIVAVSGWGHAIKIHWVLGC